MLDNLSLYIHFPWCIQKCPYCDFNSHRQPQIIPYDNYVKQLLADLNSCTSLVTNRIITSIFFGGGTPSLLPANHIANILDYISHHFSIAKDIEITLEVNPGSIEHDCMQSYCDAGITRISLGAQSMQDDKLHTLGRIHNATSIHTAINKILACSFHSFNVDLMYGLPNQTINDAACDLNSIIDYQPQHISWYQLTLEPNTAFYHKPPPLPSDETIWKIQQHGQQLLGDAGYLNYEVSAFSQPDYFCQHNLNYWQYGDYLGIGPGAHSKITSSNGKITRLVKFKHPTTYLNQTNNFTQQQSTITAKERIFEFMLNNLRLTNGFTIANFVNKVKLPISTITPILDKARQQHLIDISNEQIKPTKLGMRFLNDLTAMFL